MDDYKKIGLIYEASTGQVDAYDRGNKTSRKYLPRTDGKNSVALTTSSLPGGTQQLNQAAMGTGGGISQDEEEVVIKGFGKVSKAEVQNMFDRTLKDIVRARKVNHNYIVLQKLNLLNVLSHYL